MLKYDYFSSLCTLTKKGCTAAELACKNGAQASVKISKALTEAYTSLCELERALFSEFIPPLDRSGIVAYAHSLCSLSDAALLYSTASPTRRFSASAKGFDGYCVSLCDILNEGAASLDGIKKSSEIPRIEEFRSTRSQALASVYVPPLSPQAVCARQGLLFAISGAFDTLIELILKSI